MTYKIYNPLATIGTPAPNSPASVKAGLDLKNRTYFVTGGARGLGLNLICAILEVGGSAIAFDLLPEPVSKEWSAAKALAEENGGSLTFNQLNVSNEAEVEELLPKLAEQAASAGRPIHGLVNCAGVNQALPAIDYPLDLYRKIVDINFIGSFVMAKHTAKVLVAANVPGSIVLIGSMSGSIANRGLANTAYNTSKAGVLQLARSLCQEWGQYGIRVNTISPGYIITNMTQSLLDVEPELYDTWMRGAMLNRLATPDDFKSAVVFLLGDGSRFMTGSDLLIDGGHCAGA
ncbi:hypothetical protein OGAPHI_001375 [Ogataea philodendri]|uniref:Uncharacterized protein n=1 Tax=Ogataea philodendri TaxID=1378263 RepID=A0A9P8PDG1_9ASCO|nr:uncharacterized protein OGAPHI_001375 [Ogataea philodendri]KAH3669254.1 hypothetical protein OGAPHI_001375 [Ogataea philodendri]